MFRLSVLLLLALPVAASASPRALGQADQVARAGTDAVLTKQTSKTITVSAAPLAGGLARTLLAARIPKGRFVDVVTAASDRRVATLVRIQKGGVPESTQLYAGAGDGTLAPVPDTGEVDSIDVAGDTVILFDDQKTLALAPDGTRRQISLPGVVSQTHFAGDLVAFGQSESEEELEELPPKTLILENWATGEQLRKVALPERMTDLDLRPDGAVVVAFENGKLAVITVDGDLKRLDARSGEVAWAGDRIVVGREQVERGTHEIVSSRTSVIEPNGSQRRLGVEARFVDQLSGSTEDLLAVNSGCAMVTPIGDGPATSYTGDACMRSDAYITNSKRMPLRRAFSVPIRCLHAHQGQPCTGRIRGGRVEPRSYAVPAGKTADVRVRLRTKAWRAVRHRKQVLVHLSAPSDSYVLLRSGS